MDTFPLENLLIESKTIKHLELFGFGLKELRVLDWFSSSTGCARLYAMQISIILHVC